MMEPLLCAPIDALLSGELDYTGIFGFDCPVKSPRAFSTHALLVRYMKYEWQGNHAQSSSAPALNDMQFGGSQFRQPLILQHRVHFGTENMLRTRRRLDKIPVRGRSLAGLQRRRCSVRESIPDHSVLNPSEESSQAALNLVSNREAAPLTRIDCGVAIVPGGGGTMQKIPEEIILK